MTVTEKPKSKMQLKFYSEFKEEKNFAKRVTKIYKNLNAYIDWCQVYYVLASLKGDTET
jgi:hypothetical protein